MRICVFVPDPIEQMMAFKDNAIGTYIGDYKHPKKILRWPSRFSGDTCGRAGSCFFYSATNAKDHRHLVGSE